MSNQTTDLAKPAPKTLTLGDLLERRRDLIAAVVPKHMTPERVIKIATVAVSRIPKLKLATAESIVAAVVRAAELGLDCSGTLGSAYLVPFTNNRKDKNGQWTSTVEAQLIIGYRGLIDLARRSGQIASIEARVVYADDEFDYEFGLKPKLFHKPKIDRPDGEVPTMRLVYAIAHLKDGSPQVEIMTRASIDAVRRRSKAANDGPWVTDYDEMARKTVVKRLSKYLPLSVEFASAIEADNQAEFVDSQLVSDSEYVPKIDRANRMLNEADAPPAKAKEPEAAAPAEPASGATEPHGEQPADAGEADNTAPTNDAPESQPEPKADDLSTWPSFYELATEAAVDQCSSAEFAQGIQAALMLVAKKGKAESTTVAWRRKTLDAIRAKRFDFATGKVAKE